MIGGDLDDAPLPAEVYVVWEELLGIPSAKFTPKRFSRRVRWHRYPAALDLYETNRPAVQTLWDLWEEDQPIAIVTYLPIEVVGSLAQRLDRENIPNTRLITTQPLHMCRLIAHLDGVARIVHSIPAHNLLYGPKGFLVPPQSPELIREVL